MAFRRKHSEVTKEKIRKKLQGIKHTDERRLNPLCRNCHAQTNYKREDWSDYLKRKVSE